MGSESKTINAVVNALAAEAEHVNLSQESVAKLRVGERCIEGNQKRTLPRPKSENNFISPDISSNGRPSFHKSDTIHKQINMQ